jgi:pilus assembly protein Flp/PilA
MKTVFSQVICLLRDEDGHSLVEYGILLVAIAVVCIAAVQSIGGSASRMYQSAAQSGTWTP